ncbi:hypothetical protein WKP56_004605 [Escherichia coli]|uniref:YopT-type cysteine protease domain-containing protein n=2 Tax=Escherichia coli TaxID=562 RepID=UPI00025C8362|nr:YopT-type cysteine protease domain-containing protein [Escherichia coli]EES4110886.1 hypothetical protein [Escherichia coli]EET6315728.1 hypothetical protein [Escherichia coli]EFB5914027.1 hypothetical protein [Escherichia coli]EFC7394345.1 hypothetical protein [Escherichia coli]EFC7399789.1 hypothetical protein [Escherichia coli]
MENIFKFSQNEFIKSQHTDRNIYNGLCFFMCVDYIYNKSNNIKCDFIFFSKTYAFSSRYRGMLLAYESGAIKDPYLIKNGKIHLKKIKESVNPVEIYNIKDDSYVINLSLSNGKMSHATAFIKNGRHSLFFDPNFGEYIVENKMELISFLKLKYKGYYNLDNISLYSVKPIDGRGIQNSNC